MKPRYRSQAQTIERLFKEEFRLLKIVTSWKHTHILEYLAAYKTYSGGPFGCYALVLPYADGGSLCDFLRLPEVPQWLLRSASAASTSNCSVVFEQILGITEALALLHNKMDKGSFIIHRDIKPSNILIRKGVFKLADFGFSSIKDAEDTSKTTWYVGTPLYAPPERTLQYMESTGRARDTWAMGCVILEILVLLCLGFSQEPAVEKFERERLLSSGERESKAFSLTMDCVNEWIERLDEMIKSCVHDRLADQKRLENLLFLVRGMLNLEPKDRITASKAHDHLRSLRNADAPLYKRKATDAEAPLHKRKVTVRGQRQKDID
jgi:serine/threonine protein kinase